MNTYHGKKIEHWKNNAEEDYFTTPISVLKYITVLEEQAKQMEKEQIVEAFYEGVDQESDTHGAMNLDMKDAENYYNETFKTK